MYADLGPGHLIDLDEPLDDVELLYSHKYVAQYVRWYTDHPEGNLYSYAFSSPVDWTDPTGQYPPPAAKPGSGPRRPTPGSGSNSQRLLPYLFPSCCTAKKDRLKPIPGVATPAKNPIPGTGPHGGFYQIYPFPTTPAAAVGGGGAATCIVLVVKCKGIVAVFHFTVGDSPSDTLARFTWPKKLPCDAIICGGNNEGVSNCLADDVISAASGAGLNLVGVSGNSGCGVDASGRWYEFGN